MLQEQIPHCNYFPIHRTLIRVYTVLIKIFTKIHGLRNVWNSLKHTCKLQGKIDLVFFWRLNLQDLVLVLPPSSWDSIHEKSHDYLMKPTRSLLYGGIWTCSSLHHSLIKLSTHPSFTSPSQTWSSHLCLKLLKQFMQPHHLSQKLCSSLSN